MFAGEFDVTVCCGKPVADFGCIPGNGEALGGGGAGDMRLPVVEDGDPDKCFGPNGLSLEAWGCCECGEGEARALRGSLRCC